jgi:trehalose 6-phosphate synthase
LGEALRQRGVKNPIGFFLHIPWPAPELMATLPRHSELTRTLFAYDLVGFQCEAWLNAFKAYVVDEAGGEVVAGDRLRAFGRIVSAGVFPIGIDLNSFKRIAASPGAVDSYVRAAATGLFRSTVIGVDRVDYSKGLEERFLAFERLLQDHPELVEKVNLLQVGQPSRVMLDAYGEIGKTLDAVSGRINGRYATVDWTPIRYLNRSCGRDHIAGLYRAARVGLVTPLRDGMNLVAKEYVAAQDLSDPGVLILSRFAGAAAQMKQALIVNPYSREDVADAIHQALAMPKAERIARWRELIAGIEREDADAWRESFLRTLRLKSSALACHEAA